MTYINRLFLILLAIVLGIGTLTAQEDSTATEIPAEKQLSKDPFQSGICMDLQTVVIPPAKTLEFVLQHRFGTIQDQWSTLFGIYGSANIRMGLNFSITKDLLVGLGTTKNNMLQDLQVKYTFLRQREEGTPLTIAYYGNLALNAYKPDTDYGSDYKFIDRMSWYHEFLFARRFCNYFSGQIGLSYTHFNKVDKSSDSTAKNDALAFSVLGRFKISPQSSIVVSYQQPIILNYDPAFVVRYPDNWMEFPEKAPYPNISLGWEIATSTHAFHIYVSAANGIVPSEIVMNNQNNFFNGFILFGFNMTRLWSF